MPAPSAFAPFLDPLERLALPYCITGSVAASVYGEPRLTVDIDLGGSGAWIAPPEYVILRKLEFLREGGSDKHLRDIRFILAATAVDRSFIESEVGRRDLRGQWLKAADSQ